MIINILIGLVVIVVVVALQPSDFRIPRSANISAPAEVVFRQVNDLHKWEAWSPWAKLDPAEFTFKPEGNQTTVTWSMFGKNNFISKAVGLFMDCDKMVGGQFEQGLAQLKSVAEAADKK